MKRILILGLLSLMLVVATKAADLNVTAIIYGNYFTVADNDFEDKYGGEKIFPEGKLALRLTGNMYIWGSFGYFPSSYKWTKWSNKGVVNVDLQGESVVDKQIISGGIGFFIGYIRPSDFALKGEVGLCYIANKDEVTYTYISDSSVLSTSNSEQNGLGFRANIGMTYGLLKHVYAEACIGYLYASEKVNEERINLGGLRLSMGLGLKF